MKKKSTAKKIKLPPLPVIGKVQPPPDLSKFTKATCEAIYSYVVLNEFSMPFIMNHGLDIGLPLPIPATERLELTVFHMYGRWFAAWRCFEANQHLPYEHRFKLLHVTADPEAAGGLKVQEI
jgi:hypothetical protein